MNDSSIGVIDSGSGGLSIMQAIQSFIPSESITYIGDHAYSPYGDKSQDIIKQRIVAMIAYLVQKKCKLIVVACNTATVAGIEYFRERFPEVPIVGVVPVIKTASRLSKTKKFVVLSTNFTAGSTYQQQLIDKWASDCTVMNLGSSALVPLVEQGKCDGPEVASELKRLFAPNINSGYDIVALGCTHYPFIRDAIQKTVGSSVRIIDSSEAVARQVERILAARGEQSQEFVGSETFLTTGNEETVTSLFTQLLGRKVHVTHVTV